ncbi:MAG: zinc ribbon domain-containing protein [Eubacterium sp.]|nr:zinc ribbon domain-containing protein [Eubacterium sp.]
MRCSKCGNEIPAGAPACPICGAPAVQQFAGQPQGQPMQQGFPGPQQFGGPQPQYQQPYGNTYQPKPAVYYYPGGPFAERMRRGDYTMLCSLIGAFFVFLFTVIPAWVSSSLTSVGLFAEPWSGLVKFSAVLLIIVSLWLMFRYLVIYNIIPGINLTRLTNLPGSEWYGPAGALLLFFLVTFNGDVQDVVKSSEVSFGVSWWFALIGVLLLFVRPIVCIIKSQKFHTGERVIRQQAQSYAYQRPPQQYSQPINQFGQPQQFGGAPVQPQQFGASQAPQQFNQPQGQQPNNPNQ